MVPENCLQCLQARAQIPFRRSGPRPRGDGIGSSAELIQTVQVGSVVIGECLKCFPGCCCRSRYRSFAQVRKFQLHQLPENSFFLIHVSRESCSQLSYELAYSPEIGVTCWFVFYGRS